MTEYTVQSAKPFPWYPWYIFILCGWDSWLFFGIILWGFSDPDPLGSPACGLIYCRSASDVFSSVPVPVLKLHSLNPRPP
jgi:hypothetical protein